MALQFNHKPIGSLIGSGSYKFRHYGSEVQPRFIALQTGGNILSYSADGNDWSNYSTLPGSNYYNSVAFGGNRVVCVGNSISAYSEDCEIYTLMTDLPTGNYKKVIYGGGKFICVGEYGVSACSVDGVSWNPMTGLNNNLMYYSLAYNDGVFICVGGRDYSEYTVDDSGCIYRSTDGLTWTQITSNIPVASFYDSVAYGSNKFICVGTYINSSTYSMSIIILYSTDNGLNWTSVSNVPQHTLGYLGLAYGGNRFVLWYTSGIYGLTSTSYSSTDGITWTAMNELPTLESTYEDVRYGFVYGLNKFIAVQNENTVYKCEVDSNTWERLYITGNIGWGDTIYADFK